MKNYYTEKTNFFGGSKPSDLLKEYGSPLYVYNEAILRERCREMAHLVSYPHFVVNYSAKANSNLEILKIIREEGLHADAVSPGEIYLLLAAGFKPEEILFVSNKISAEEMEYATKKGVLISCDSISQLRRYGSLFPGGKIAVRFNPGVGAGHHEKVITGGKNTKFGVSIGRIDEVRDIIKEYGLKLSGINQHIGSLFMETDAYVKGVNRLFEIAEQFDELEFIDMGGGFGVPYRKQDGQEKLKLKESGLMLDRIIERWTAKQAKTQDNDICHIAAECGVLGTVHSVKRRGQNIHRYRYWV